MDDSGRPTNARLCLWLEDDEFKCYANREALKAISSKLAEISEQAPIECAELHVRLYLSDELRIVRELGVTADNVWVVDRRTSSSLLPNLSEDLVPQDGAPFGPEVTFMHVSDEVLDSLKSDKPEH